MNHEARRIPLVIIEEHHEAFYVWEYAIRRGWLPESNNTLLHVDAHADMWLPRLRQPLRRATSLRDLARFVYYELDIGSFIWPAVYLEQFNRLLWLRHQHRMSAGGWRKLIISEKLAGPREFQLFAATDAAAELQGPRGKSVDYCPVTTGELVKTDQAIVLDIDLDYFSCNSYPELPFHEIEVTADTFHEFNGNRYHFLRLPPGEKVSATRRGNKYYLTFNDYHSVPLDSAASAKDASGRLNDLVRFLRTNSVAPELIIVSRSYFSGYTPQALVAVLESRLLEALSDLHPVQILTIDSILPVGLDRAPTGTSLSLPPRKSHRGQLHTQKLCTQVETHAF
jgi:hypothetical protein